MDNSFAFSEVVRKLANIIRLGKIAEIDGDQVRVEIGRVKTGWLPIVSNAGNTSLWLPISEGEQVAVFAPYGEMAQAFVLRSIHYNTYKIPENVNNLSLTTDKNVKFSSPEKYEASFSKGLKFISEKCVITKKSASSYTLVSVASFFDFLQLSHYWKGIFTQVSEVLDLSRRNGVGVQTVY